MIEKISKETFLKLLKTLKVQEGVNKDFIYEIYSYAIDGINELNEDDFIIHIYGINQMELINYSIGEYLYSTALLNEEDLTRFINNENNIALIASIVSDKYLSLSIFNHRQEMKANRYLPPISTLNLYLNFIINVLDHVNKNDPKTTLLVDLLNKSISLSRCILNLLIDGYMTEAYATWRTLHECECTLMLLEKYGEPLIALYLRHMQYGIAYKNGMKSKEETDNIFVEIKSKMAEHDLKSKDMKKYIEYGWLYGVDEFNALINPKLNFKDGLEVASGLTQYGNSYNLSSEIVHATPILIYSNNDYFFRVTLLSLYEAFFRLERIFVNLFGPRVNKENMNQYLAMRKMYYSHLVNIYNREKNIFVNKNK